MKKVLLSCIAIVLLSMGMAKPDLREASEIISKHFGYPKIEIVLLTNDSIKIIQQFKDVGLMVLETDLSGKKVLDTNWKYKEFDLSEESNPSQKIYVTNSVRLKSVEAIRFNKAETKATVSYLIEQTAITPFGKRMGKDTLVFSKTIELDFKDNQWQILMPQEKTLSELDWQVSFGEIIFARNCAACHLKDGGGLIGPNLTDKYFVLGGTEQDIYQVIRDGGRSGKGMISWKQSLSKAEMVAVTKFIKLKLEGSTPANPKEAEGELMSQE